SNERRGELSRDADGVGRHGDSGADRILLTARRAATHLLRAMALPALAHLPGRGVRVCTPAGRARPCGAAMAADRLGPAVHLCLRVGPAMARTTAVLPALAAQVARRTSAPRSP